MSGGETEERSVVSGPGGPTKGPRRRLVVAAVGGSLVAILVVVTALVRDGEDHTDAATRVTTTTQVATNTTRVPATTTTGAPVTTAASGPTAVAPSANAAELRSVLVTLRADRTWQVLLNAC